MLRAHSLVGYGDYVNKFGYNADVDAATAAEDITPWGNYAFRTAAAAAADIDIVSSDAADTAAGTGARTIQIYGLDANYKMQTEVVTLSGATDVHPANDYIHIYRAKVLTTGTGLVNAGNITIDVDGANDLAYIPLGRGQTLQATYIVPADYSFAYLFSWYVSLESKASAYANMALEVKEFGSSWQTKEIVGVHANNLLRIDKRPLPLAIPAKASIRVRAIDASADNLPISAGFALLLE